MPNQESSDDEAFAGYGQALFQAVSEAVRPWLRILVDARVTDVDAGLHIVLEQVAVDAEQAIRVLIDADVETPLSGPLERIRRAVEPLNVALAERDAPPPRRNPLDVEMRPHDLYDLGPMTFRDLGDAVHDAGIAWGAAKAHVHMQRRRDG